MSLKAIVVRQPWATLIAHGLKTIETRGFQPRTTLAPGDDLAIVAGKAEPTAGEELGDSGWYWENTPADPCCLVNWKTSTFLPAGSAPLGAVVAVVRYRDALRVVNGAQDHDPRPIHLDAFAQPEWPDNDLHAHCGELGSDLRSQLPLGDFTPGRYGWLLGNPRRLTTPVPVTGKQGVFSLPDDVTEQVLTQLPTPNPNGDPK